jgi:hypothetical protein
MRKKENSFVQLKVLKALLIITKTKTEVVCLILDKAMSLIISKMNKLQANRNTIPL